VTPKATEIEMQVQRKTGSREFVKTFTRKKLVNVRFKGAIVLCDTLSLGEYAQRIWTRYYIEGELSYDSGNKHGKEETPLTPRSPPLINESEVTIEICEIEDVSPNSIHNLLYNDHKEKFRVLTTGCQKLAVRFVSNQHGTYRDLEFVQKVDRTCLFWIPSLQTGRIIFLFAIAAALFFQYL